jgi:proline iminopeptidase
MATLENHYFLHNAWLSAGQLLAAARRIPATVPVFIVQGRYDMICPPAAAIQLTRVISHSRIRLTVAGHAWDDPENLEGIKEGLKKLRDYDFHNNNSDIVSPHSK